MRGDLVKREPARIEHWKKIGLYKKIQKARAGAPKFVLHDGPPFTNGDVHIGTALNKILKDAILRYKTMRGLCDPLRPGLGLPRAADRAQGREAAAQGQEGARHSAAARGVRELLGIFHREAAGAIRAPRRARGLGERI